jgi:hypothetical protein
MKNIHVLPTEKPSRLHKIENEWGLTHNANSNPFAKQQNIYITSDEYIGLSYYLDGNLVRKGVVDDKEYWEVRKDYKKIILTTDPDLIKDGVQAIDDEFLEWFVKNPSCERVEVEDFPMTEKYNSKGEYVHRSYWVYKIIIPRTTQQIINQDYAGGLEMGQIPAKEEPKQETLEEVAKERLINHNLPIDEDFGEGYIAGAILGAKWQQEQDNNKYSEEEVYDILIHHTVELFKKEPITLEDFWNKFKKK